ncbi:hypothetical protein PCASD_06700 [Puccinia coronata f. sp. avenae]|uniref:Uncharacterized protein n=1 Tax=Puccinia coronata f. sp. avenae TaxID=200324 RepID=A0A2N5TF42_9BASI|nr:hypothetical protein PCASD_06700 [Puccinia coronata f. sp. avenae]
MQNQPNTNQQSDGQTARQKDLNPMGGRDSNPMGGRDSNPMGGCDSNPLGGRESNLQSGGGNQPGNRKGHTHQEGQGGTPNPLADILAALGDTPVVPGTQGSTTVGSATPVANPANSNPAATPNNSTVNQEANQGATTTEPPQGGGDPTPKPQKTRVATQEDIDFLVGEARLACVKGNDKYADTLLCMVAKSYMVMEPPTAPPTWDAPKEPPKLSGNLILVKEGPITFSVGEIPNYDHCGLPQFYNQNLKQLKGSIPLTIFNPKWQQKAAAISSERRTSERAGLEDRRYTGHPAPDKWSQSYAQWSRNYQRFTATLTEAYQFGTLAKWFHIHKERVDRIMSQDGFFAGFRYNLAAYSNARARDKLVYPNNPYIEGGAREDYDLHSGDLKANVLKKRAEDAKAKQKPNNNNRQGQRWEPYPGQDQQANSRNRQEHRPDLGSREGYKPQSRKYEEKARD